eukprot:TRINITY_DN14209_c0_g1_i1.p1 TRINITY_DN14209_c0_g1~~TRINITY_DN14209_c0_g1_i1.p1  ORF type:complete len:349 (+),score=123.73 TRINITY_DN14209_c0_g1_i1:3-1049(+)
MNELFGKGKRNNNAKKWCDCCNMFVINNPTALNKHNTSEKHKRNLQKTITNKRNENKDEYYKQRELQKLEMLASKSLQNDIKNGYASHLEMDKFKFNNTNNFKRNNNNKRNEEQKEKIEENKEINQEEIDFYNQQIESNKQKKIDQQKNDQIKQNEKIKTNNQNNSYSHSLIPPPPPPPPIPEGMTDPKEIKEFINNFIAEYFRKFFEKNQSNPQPEDKEEYNNEIEGENVNNLDSENGNYTGFGKWQTVEKKEDEYNNDINEYNDYEENKKGEKDWMKMEKFEEDAEQDVDEQYDPNTKLNLPDSDDSDSDSEKDKKNSPVLFKSKRNINSRKVVPNKKIKTEDEPK